MQIVTEFLFIWIINYGPKKVMFLNHSNVTSGNVAMWGRVDPLAAAQSQAGNLTHDIK